MATYGQSSRNRPALYKPTDFGSHQKRSNSSSSCETKKEEEKVTFKIQQRPTADEKPQEMENSKSVKILKEVPSTEKKESSKKVEEKPGGVAQKDIDKITKLKEFMAKQEIGDEVPKATTVSTMASSISKDTGQVTSKPSISIAKTLSPVPMKTLATAPVKPLPNGKGLGTHCKTGTGNSPGIIPTKPNTFPTGKPFKENKDLEISKEEKSVKGKDKRDGKEGKTKGSGGRPNAGRNQKNANKPPAARNKQNQNEKQSVNKTNRNDQQNQPTKPLSKPSSSINNGGTRPKIITTKASVSNNARLSNETHKNHNRPYDRPNQNQMNVNSYYSQANKVQGFPNNEAPPWLSLPYAMNGLHLNNQSILGQPQGPRLDYNQKPLPASQEKNTDQIRAVASTVPPASQKKVVTVAATKDKSEQKKSLDFVKSFFDNDPEVQYNRKLNAETRNTSIKPPATSGATTAASKEEAPTNRLLVSNHIYNQVNSHVNSQVNSHVNSHVNGHVNSLMNNHVNSQINSQTNSCINTHGNTHAYSHVNSHVNSQSFVHPSSHIPGGQIPGTHIPGSMATTYSSVYHHSNMSNMGHNSLHPNPQSGHFQDRFVMAHWS